MTPLDNSVIKGGPPDVCFHYCHYMSIEIHVVLASPGSQVVNYTFQREDSKYILISISIYNVLFCLKMFKLHKAFTAL